MWQRIRQKFTSKSQTSSRELSAETLAFTIVIATRDEALLLEKSLELPQEEIATKMPRVLWELLAFHQYLALAWVANVAQLDSQALGLFGGTLNLELAKIANLQASEEVEALLMNTVNQAVSSDDFHKLVSAYLGGDVSISGLAPEEWTGLLKFTSFEALSEDFMAINRLSSFTRLLEAIGTRYGESGKLAVLVWMTHNSYVQSYENEVLRPMLQEAFPDRLR